MIKLYVSLPQGDTWGWGVCGKNIVKALKKRDDIEIVDDYLKADAAFICIDNIAMCPYDPNANWVLWEGHDQKIPVISYCFFEEELPDVAKQNSSMYSLILAGSTWCADKLKAKGIHNVDVLIQGVDPELFYPCDKREDDGKFVLFSGGKFEYRKGQDIVLAAFKLLQDKYPNLELVTNWNNQWDFSMDTMAKSEYIEYARVAPFWQQNLDLICQMNGIDSSRVKDIGIIPNDKMRDVYARTDLGVFPNRCEGGTNLVLMEYMACGRPVLANATTGQEDLFHEDVRKMGYFIPEDLAFAIEAMIALEKANAWKKNAEIGLAERMKQFTWDKTADNLIIFVKREMEIKELTV